MKRIGKKSSSDMSDAELVIACQQKDETALTYLLTRHERTIISMLYRLAPDWKDNADLVQEVNIRIWRFINQVRNPHSFKTWLNQIVTNLFYDELRKRPRQYKLVSMDETISNKNGSERGTRDIKDASPQPEDKLLTNELSLVLAEAMSSISEQFRTAAVLRDIDGLSYEEIAQITNTELGTVKSRISRARLKIQQKLSPYLNEAA
jgi:RNA polymerase sigma-70 factor (ECF subfamily)